MHLVLSVSACSLRLQSEMPLHDLIVAAAVDLVLRLQYAHVMDIGARWMRLEFTHLFFVFQRKYSDFAPQTTSDH